MKNKTFSDFVNNSFRYNRAVKRSAVLTLVIEGGLSVRDAIAKLKSAMPHLFNSKAKIHEQEQSFLAI